MATVHYDGQNWTVPDAVANNDALLKQTLRQAAPHLGDPKLDRKTENGELHVYVVKQAGPKGAGALDLRHIRTDGGTQARSGLDEATVFQYAEALEDGAQFPPVLVYQDGSDHWLADGFHRVAAYRHLLDVKNNARWAAIPAEVRMGTRRDAMLHALGANATHGLPRSNADKRRAVETLLRDPEWVAWSDGKIAQVAAVSQPFVSTVRRELVSQNEIESPQARMVERDGQLYSMTPGARSAPVDPAPAAKIADFVFDATTAPPAPPPTPPAPTPPLAAAPAPPAPPKPPPPAPAATPLPPSAAPPPPALAITPWHNCGVQVVLHLLPVEAPDAAREVLISATNGTTQAVAFGADLVPEATFTPWPAPVAAVLASLHAQHPAEATP